MKIIAATRNEGKVREFRRLLGGLPLEIESLMSHPEVCLPPETGASYAENAAIKARAASLALGLPSFGDDSGLEVDFLGGTPGTLSARFASPDGDAGKNIEKLLKLMENAPDEQRSARFRAVLVLVYPDPWKKGMWREATFEGVFEGFIARRPDGEGGFGYDPVFLSPLHGRTVARLGDEEKDAFSHRGIAARKMMEFVRNHLMREAMKFR